jgi:hypothetical protein
VEAGPGASRASAFQGLAVSKTAQIAVFLLVALLGGLAAKWRIDRNRLPPAPEQSELQTEHLNESMRELDQAAQKSEAANEQRKTLAPFDSSTPAAEVPLEEPAPDDARHSDR